MKVGDYVRTKDGIIGTLYGNYAYDENQLAILTKSNENGVEYTQEYSKDEIINSSPNIIDLIEVGDLMYIDISPDNCGGIVVPRIAETKNELDTIINKIKTGEYILKSITTHEQIESMEYKVKE